ncbi:hypothetical protein GOBAR_AA33969 [Gossypium barbadense]|uniref:Myb/SANT-like domain-containing protein n=1 Tax=Gossypium barbadense TaxID=3634 RepID=A0A2P5W6M7_GOSBA|nr:hypothetical protein GOBAR_AA33969 [Gossypium barbadense]
MGEYFPCFGSSNKEGSNGGGSVKKLSKKDSTKDSSVGQPHHVNRVSSGCLIDLDGLSIYIFECLYELMVFHNQVFLPKILEEPKGNEFQKKMLRWLPVWLTCTMLEPLMHIWDSKPAKPNLESMIRTLKKDWTIIYDMLSGKNNSGFGWDEHRQLVIAEDAVWNSYINNN